MIRAPMLAALIPGLFLVAGVAAEPLPIEASPVALHSEDDTLDRVGKIRFLGGLHLTSPDRRFGGVSGLAVSADGRQLSLVTDTGSWIQAVPRYDSHGRLVGIVSARIGALLGPDGQKPRRKRERDAESLFRTKDGLLVSFEHNHRFWLYRGGPNPFLNKPGLIALPRALGGAPRNSGIEAAAVLPDGRLFALAENFPRHAPYVKGWVREGGRWRSLDYERTALFHPTGAAVLSNGDLLVLERRFTYVGGFAARFVRVAASSLQEKKISGTELARLEPPFIEENFEGLDARRDRRGRTLVYVISDDNFFALQKTILLLFALEP